jgi:hypothetical protein
MKERLFALSILLATTHISLALSAATEIIISVPDQQLALIDRGKLISKYAISTSRFGLGDGNGLIERPSAHCLFQRSSVIICRPVR